MSFTYGIKQIKPYVYVFGRPVYPTYSNGLSLPIAESNAEHEIYRSSDFLHTGAFKDHCVELKKYKKTITCDLCQVPGVWFYEEPRSGFEYCIQCCKKFGLNIQ